jgi:hypothetical protein
VVHDEIPTAEVMALLDVRDIGPGRNSAMLFWRKDIEQLADERRQELLDGLARLDAARAAS